MFIIRRKPLITIYFLFIFLLFVVLSMPNRINAMVLENRELINNNLSDTMLTQETSVSDFEFKELEGETIEIVKYIGKNLNVIIPSMYQEKQVSSIGDNVFFNSEIKEIIIPTSIKNIGNKCFENSKLEKIVFEEDSMIESIGDKAFGMCINLKEFNTPKNLLNFGKYSFYGCKNLSTVKFDLESKITAFPEGLFYSCTNLSEVIIPNSVSEIGDYCFYNCSNIKEFPSNEDIDLLTIGEYAFSKSGIIDLKVPKSVELIKEYAFSYSNIEYAKINNNKINELYIEKGIFHKCNNMKKLEIPFVGAEKNELFAKSIGYIFGMENDSVNSTSEYIPQTLKEIIINGDGKLAVRAFEDCSYIEKVTISKNITSIGDYAFDSCNKLVSVVFEENSLLNSIGIYAFSQCDRLLSIDIPNNVTTIGLKAFHSCSSLEKVTLPEKLYKISSDAFRGCNLLYEVHNNSNLNIEFGSTNNGSVGLNAKVIYDKDGNAVYLNNNERIIVYNDFTFLYSNSQYWLLNYCGNEEKVYLPEDINGEKYKLHSDFQIIAEWLFIPKSMTTIEDSVFFNSKIKNIVIPNSLQKVGKYAFLGDKCVENVYYNGTIEDWCNISFTTSNSNPMYAAESFFMLNEKNEYEEITEIVIPETVKSIKNYQFYGFKNVKRFVLSEGIKELLRYSFGECDSIVSIELPDSLEEVYSNVFYNCDNLENIYISDGTKKIEEGFYVDCPNVKYISCSNSVYINSPSLIELSLSVKINIRYNSDDSYTIYGNAVYDKEMTTLYSIIPNQESIIIPKTLKIVKNQLPDTFSKVYFEGSIEDWCNIQFKSANYHFMKYASEIYMLNEKNEYEEITELIIPSTVEKIGSYQFYGFNKLNKIVISNGVVSIGESAFSKCSSLVDIYLSSSVNNIDNYAFAHCEKLENVYYNGTIEDWCNIKFSITSNPVDGSPIFAYSSPMGFAKYFYIQSDNNEYEELTSINIPESITSISLIQFYGFDNIVTIKLHNMINNIGELAFAYCEKLESIELPNTIKYLKTGLFEKCKSLKEILIPQSVISIEKDVFFGCENLTSIEIPDGVKKIEEGTFKDCINLLEIIIPNSITELGTILIYGTSSISGKSIFSGCDKLLNVYYKGTIEEWCNIKFKTEGSNPMSFAEKVYMLDDNNEFYEVSEITIPDSITVINKYQFYEYHNLKSIKLHENVTNIYDEAFGNCINLHDIYNYSNLVLNISQDSYGKIAKNALVIYNKDSSKTYINDANEIIVEDNGFVFINVDSEYFLHKYNGDKKELILPKDVNSNKYTINLVYCSAEKIVIPEGIDIISLKGCENLKELVLPEGLTMIPQGMLENIGFLESITIPKSIKNIASSCFKICEITNVYYNGSMEDWCNIVFFDTSSNPMFRGKHFYMLDNNERYYEVTEIKIPNTINSVTDNTFYGFNNIKTVIIPKNINTIYSYAFGECENLKNVYYEGTVEDWCEIRFLDSYAQPMYYAEHFYTLNENNEYCELTELILANNVTQINAYQFLGFDNLIRVYIPDSVTTINNAAFKDCVSLSNVVIENKTIFDISHSAFTNTLIKEISYEKNDGLFYVDDYLIDVNENVKEVVLRDGTIISELIKYTSWNNITKVTAPLSVIGGSHLPTNIKDLIITDIKSTDKTHIYCFDTSLENIYLSSDCYIYEKFIGTLQNVSFYVDICRECVDWDTRVPNWNDDAKVFYKDEWKNIKFYDNNENIIYSKNLTTGSAIEIVDFSFINDENGDFEFIGWDINNDLKVDTLPLFINEDIVAKPIFIQKKYNVNFYDRDGKSIIYSYKASLGESIKLPELLENNCYEFIEWLGYYDEIVVTKDIDFYSIWNIKENGHKFTIEEIIDSTCSKRGFTKHICEDCGYYYVTDYTDLLDHQFNVTEIKPTCVTKGYTLYECSGCTYSYSDNYISATGHLLDDPYVYLEATCGNTGILRRECVHCDYYFDKEIEKLEHSNFELTHKDPSCVEEGYDGSICVDCGEIIVSSTIPSLGGHILVAHSGKEVTCTEAGYDAYEECTRCNYSTFKEIVAKGHKYSSTIVRPTCTYQGYTWHTCSVCRHSYKDTYVDALGHKYNSVVTEATCKQEGYTTHTCELCSHSFTDTFVEIKPHNYEVFITDSTCTIQGCKTSICIDCSYTLYEYFEYKEHEFVDIIKDPTCTRQGYTTHTCSVCSYSYKDTYIKAKGHQYENVVTNPTCLNKGYTTHTCKECSDSYVDSYVNPKGHNYESSIIEPTCTNQGYTIHSCKNCSYLYKDTYIKAKGHQYSDWIVLKEATCTLDGSKQRECKSCSKIETQTIQKVGHKYENIITNPTCEEIGYTTHQCVRCSKSYIDTYVDALGHQYELVIVDPTCEEKGYEKQVCITCKHSYVEVYLDALGHNFGKWVIGKKATCTEDGYDHRICETCSFIDIKNTTKIGHQYETVIINPTCKEQGCTKHICKLCSYFYEDNYIEKSNHKVSDWIIDIEPTKKMEGHKHKECEYCNEILEEESIAKIKGCKNSINVCLLINFSVLIMIAICFRRKKC